MDARTARRLLLIQAFEQTPGAAWSTADAAWATAEARRVEGSTADAERLLTRRSELAIRRLGERDAALRPWLDAPGLPGWAGTVAVAAAFTFGLLLDGFGGHPRINLLALPMLGLLLWNLVVYALLAMQTAFGPSAASSHGLRAALPAWITRRLGGAGRDTPALSRFTAAWIAAARPLHTARAAAALHTGAAMLALGLVAGLYARGVFFEYRAGWESTFFDADAAHAVLSVVLGPASALIGDPLPGAAQLAALRFPASAGENAAAWIHRIALTVVLIVVLPRLLLAAWAVHRVRQLERDLPIELDTPYFERLVRELSGSRTTLRVQPYDHPGAPDLADALGRWITQAVGGSVSVTLLPSASYGDEVAPAGAQLVLFSASTTPEAEVHGDPLRRAAGDVVAALVDETALRRRTTGPDAAVRIEQRRQAWRSMLDAAGVPAVFVDLDPAAQAAPAQALIDALRRKERADA